MSRLYLVTGSNRGIGLEIVRQLAKAKKNDTIILTSRQTDGKQMAADINTELGQDNVKFHQLDVTSEESCKSIAQWVKNEFGGLDVLINNAGYATKGNDVNETIARDTIGVNYYGVRKVTESLLPIVRDNGRIIIVSSQAGLLNSYSKSLTDQFLDNNITVPQLDKLVEEFITYTKTGEHRAHGWPHSTYKVSKVAVNTYTRILEREYKSDPRKLFIAALCPGWVSTRMGGPNASRGVEKGAETPVWLATVDTTNLPNGKFWKDKTEISW
eukprot:TRINITY_DN11251_c0_g1_i1.p1 TRINITY_DN11251_c0_g1~~TRINITY_DN11251_c0_g1_i1.p1  ORF type:complete len:270 (+),score=38.61 TRINITY_DN11251_c0_g1_i1:21-830(+)